MQMMGNDAIAIIPTAPVRLRNRDVEYAYRADSDFYYLTGFPEPEAVALNSSEASTTFTREAEWPTLGQPLHRLMYQDSVSYLPDDIFAKVDRAAESMWL